MLKFRTYFSSSVLYSLASPSVQLLFAHKRRRNGNPSIKTHFHTLLPSPSAFILLLPIPFLSNDLNTNTLRLRNNRLTQSLQRQSRQSQLRMLDLRDLINMLQRHLSHKLLPRASGTLQLSLANWCGGGVQEHIGGVRGAQLEVETAIWAHGDAGWDWDAGCDVSGASVEFL